MTVLIASSFTKSLDKLTAQEQSAAKITAFDIQQNPESPGLSMHRVDRARDPNFWTARVNRDLRIVLHKTGGTTLLAYIDHHDDAYAWAERRKLESHPRTGAAQIVEIRETVEEVVIQRYVEEAVRKPRLFADTSDDELLDWGVPEEWLDTVRQATEDTLLDIVGHLPDEAAEALLQAAVGEAPTVRIGGKGEEGFEHPDAQRRFRVVANEQALADALDAPWDEWAIFLHPAQQEFVDRDFNGPARVIGSAGTGKTVVALHRAVRLASESNEATVLLATFSDVLAEDLSRKVDRLLRHRREIRERITVGTLPTIALRLIKRRGLASNVLQDNQIAAILKNAAQSVSSEIDPKFLEDEWRLIVDAWDVRDQKRYLEIPRLGRKVRMAASRRDEVWKVFAEARRQLEDQGSETLSGAMHRLARELGRSPYSHVIVDEAQDVSVPELHLLAAMAADAANGLFFAGDIGQRIFRSPFPWKAAGVDIQGRSRSLKVNYRTSHQIRLKSELLLPFRLIEADGGEDKRIGVTSVFDGPKPELLEFSTADEEALATGEWLARIQDEGVDASAVAVLVRSDAELPRAQAAIAVSGFLSLEPSLMHKAKGREFRAVAVMACDADVIPLETRLIGASDEREMQHIYDTERHLLYVAATRARECLWLSGCTPVSEFLEDLMSSGQDDRR